ncbi:MAG: hypothetical protein IJT05_02600 [Lachnospiraceae bacterium]|nr:hypothetical protein [Lachnospiraceae bacterium]
MKLREISLFEARQNDLPASEPGEGEVRSWYALVDEDRYLGFMETTRYEEEDITEISFFMIPDLYQGAGLGNAMLTLYLDLYIPLSTPEKMLTTFFEYSGEYGDAFSEIFSGHGFDISLRSFKKCFLPVEEMQEKLIPQKTAPYKGRMVNLARGINEVLAAVNGKEDCDITVTDVRESDLELSVAAFDPEDKMTALMLVSIDPENGDAVVTDLYTASEGGAFLKKFFGFAAENAMNAETPPAYISFTAADERFEKMIKAAIGNTRTSEFVMAEGEFNLGKYVELLKIENNGEVKS